MDPLKPGVRVMHRDEVTEWGTVIQTDGPRVEVDWDGTTMFAKGPGWEDRANLLTEADLERFGPDDTLRYSETVGLRRILSSVGMESAQIQAVVTMVERSVALDWRKRAVVRAWRMLRKVTG